MPNQHPITPPPELVQQWTSLSNEMEGDEVWMEMAIFAAQWGADQELEACARWASEWCSADKVDRLLAARRPKPPSLKKQALQEVDALEGMGTCNIDTIRRALEQLDD